MEILFQCLGMLVCIIAAAALLVVISEFFTNKKERFEKKAIKFGLFLFAILVLCAVIATIKICNTADPSINVNVPTLSTTIFNDLVPESKTKDHYTNGEQDEHRSINIGGQVGSWNIVPAGKMTTTDGCDGPWCPKFNTQDGI